jgi:hypothetical protein
MPSNPTEPDPLESYAGLCATHLAIAALDAVLRIDQGCDEEPVERGDSFALAVAAARASLWESYRAQTTEPQREAIAGRLMVAEILTRATDQVRQDLAAPLLRTSFSTVKAWIPDITDGDREHDFLVLFDAITAQHPGCSTLDAMKVAQELLDETYRTGQRPVRSPPAAATASPPPAPVETAAE